ncbi:hypothetical protein NB688_000584 [Xanthomonas sacchari]|uniref:Uncharacterized protein n=1 Tax=Xanthomonas sacchari TaxID=56458 RepID=A0ABT3DUT1_9XANT|nr:hypothetical protein [Xanthomonas sacchari]MCW0398770.1 hypothetical protein [Xanthomonas sacchari]MCW0418418.1 hypothetical protein [Xanthomonas sacchari]UYK72519.1 hypothetical protein NG828_20420 [Xanthomonas sacchari]
MSQRDFLRQFDALAISAFSAAGIADTGSYYAPGSPVAQPCTVTIDRDVMDYGDDAAPVSTSRTLVGFQRSEVEPAHGGRLALPGETFLLEKRVKQDESRSQWVVTNG